MTFILERVHSISIQESFIYFSVFDYMNTERTFRSRTSHSGMSSFRNNYRSGSKFHYHVLLKTKNRKPYSLERVAHAYLIWRENHSRERLRSNRLVFAVKLAKFLMFIVFGENTVKFLEGFS